MKVEVAQLADGNWYYRLTSPEGLVTVGPGFGATSKRQALRLGRKKVREYEPESEVKRRVNDYLNAVKDTRDQLQGAKPANWEVVS